MNPRGTYGSPQVAVFEKPPSSFGKWVAGGLLVGGVVLWAKHQSSQLEKLYTSAGLPYQPFGASLRAQTRELSAKAQEKIKDLNQLFGARGDRRKSSVIVEKKEPGHG